MLVAVQSGKGPTHDRYSISLNTHSMILSFIKKHSTYHKSTSDLLLQLRLIRGSFQHFLETSSTIALAIGLDAILGHYDGDLRKL